MRQRSTRPGGVAAALSAFALAAGLALVPTTGPAPAAADTPEERDSPVEARDFPPAWPAIEPYGAADGREELIPGEHNSQVLDLELRPQDEELGRVWMRDTYVNRFEVDGESLYVATGTTRAEGLDRGAPWNDGIYVWTAPSLDGPWTLADTTGIREDQARGKVWSPEFVDENTEDRTVVADWQEYWEDDGQFGKRGNVWAPEIQYFDGTWYIVATMGDHSQKVGTFMLISEGGVEGPYRLAEGNHDKPFGPVNPGGPGFIEDGAYHHIDGGMYTEGDEAWLVLHNDLYGKFREDMEDLEDPENLSTFQQQPYDPEPYLEGAFVKKVDDKYYLMHAAWSRLASTDPEPSYSYLAAAGPQHQYDAVIAVADNFEGPYSPRWTLAVGAGHNNIFADDEGDLWSTFFRNPAQGYWADPQRQDEAAVAGVVRLERAGPAGTMLYAERPSDGTDPDDPGTDPDDPGTGPDDPGTDPDDPGTDPEDPGSDPGGPSDDGAGSKAPSAEDLVDALEDAIEVPERIVRGTEAIVSVGTGRAGEEVAAYLFSDPVPLGTATVEPDGTVILAIPGETLLGEHRLGVYDAGGELIGWAYTTVVDPAASGGDTGGDGTATSSGLGATGAEAAALTAAAALLLLLGATALLVRHRGRVAGDEGA